MYLAITRFGKQPKCTVNKPRITTTTTRANHIIISFFSINRTNLESMDSGSLSAMLPVLMGMDEPTECLVRNIHTYIQTYRQTDI